MAGRAFKRGRRDINITESFWSQEEDTGSYLSIKLRVGKPIKEKGWPWVQQSIRGILGGKEKVEKASFLADGRLLVKTKDSAQTEKLKKAVMFGGEACEIVADEKLNQSKGTIHAFDLIDLTEDEIVHWLADFGVVSARRFTRKVGDHVEKTPTVLLTFNRPSCPSRLEFDYVVYHVRKHVPNPIICRKCGKFRHMQANCPSPERKCLTCGNREHDGSCAQKCINCGQTDHNCLSWQCPTWKKEKEICVLKVTKDVSYAHARRLYETEHQTPHPRPYASAARSTSGATSSNQDNTLNARVTLIEQKLDKLTGLLEKLVQTRPTEQHQNQGRGDCHQTEGVQMADMEDNQGSKRPQDESASEIEAGMAQTESTPTTQTTTEQTMSDVDMSKPHTLRSVQRDASLGASHAVQIPSGGSKGTWSIPGRSNPRPPRDRKKTNNDKTENSAKNDKAENSDTVMTTSPVLGLHPQTNPEAEPTMPSLTRSTPL